jgi:hypothetical protein
MNMTTSLMNLSSTDGGSASMQTTALAPPLHSAASMMRVFDDDGSTVGYCFYLKFDLKLQTCRLCFACALLEPY